MVVLVVVVAVRVALVVVVTKTTFQRRLSSGGDGDVVGEVPTNPGLLLSVSSAVRACSVGSERSLPAEDSGKHGGLVADTWECYVSYSLVRQTYTTHTRIGRGPGSRTGRVAFELSRAHDSTTRRQEARSRVKRRLHFFRADAEAGSGLDSIVRSCTLRRRVSCW